MKSISNLSMDQKVDLLKREFPEVDSRHILSYLQLYDGDFQKVQTVLIKAKAERVDLSGNPMQFDSGYNEYSTGNGLAVLGSSPVDNKINELFSPNDNMDNLVDVRNFLKDMSKVSINTPDSSFSLSSEPVLKPFSGVGRRLGHIPGPSPSISPSIRQEKNVGVTFYKDCVLCDNGQRYAYDSNEFIIFRKCLDEGIVPPELVEKYPNCDIILHIIEKLSNSSPLKISPVSSAFTSNSGRTLNSVAPDENFPMRTSVAENNQSPSEAPNTSNTLSNNKTSTDAIEEELQQFLIAEDEPTCRIAILTPDNRRREFTVNPKRHTVADLHILASFASKPSPLPERYELIKRSFPVRVLKDETQTIEMACLENSLVAVKKLA